MEFLEIISKRRSIRAYTMEVEPKELTFSIKINRV